MKKKERKKSFTAILLRMWNYLDRGKGSGTLQRRKLLTTTVAVFDCMNISVWELCVPEPLVVMMRQT